MERGGHERRVLVGMSREGMCGWWTLFVWSCVQASCRQCHQPSSTPFCAACRVSSIQCSVCNVAVRGMSTMCPLYVQCQGGCEGLVQTFTPHTTPPPPRYIHPIAT